MEGQKIACAYYPTTIVVVDDNKSYLEKLQYSLGNEYLCKTFFDPEVALEYVKKAVKNCFPIKTFLGFNSEEQSYTHTSSQLPVEYDIATIYRHLYDKHRFEEVSLVIVDFAMPSMNGEKFCKDLRKIKDNPVKIIMLTGEADDPKAVELFNAGIIDMFLRKAQPNLDDELKEHIIKMQKRYFQDITFPLVKAISSEPDSCLGDPAFIDLFNQICQEISVSSYYLIELSGSFILFDKNEKPYWLIIKTLDEIIEITNQVEFELSAELMQSIQNGELVPYFGSLEYEYYCKEAVFKKCLHKAKKIKNEKTYCYAFLDNLPEFLLEEEKIVSFQQYINHL